MYEIILKFILLQKPWRVRFCYESFLDIRRTCEILNTHFSSWNIGNQFCFAKLWYTTTTFMPSRYPYTTKYNNKNLVLKNETDILFCLHSEATTKTGLRHLIHAFERVSLGTEYAFLPLPSNNRFWMKVDKNKDFITYYYKKIFDLNTQLTNLINLFLF